MNDLRRGFCKASRSFVVCGRGEEGEIDRANSADDEHVRKFDLASDFLHACEERGELRRENANFEDRGG